MTHLFSSSINACLLLCLLLCGNSNLNAQESFHRLQGQAIQRAAARVAPSVVRIETLGGLDRFEDQLLGHGPTTGVIVDPAGYIITSSFNFLSQPASILVTLQDTRRYPAKIVAQDFARHLTLIKIEAAGLPVGQLGPAAEVEVGETAIAVGRTYRQAQPNLSVGLVSAVGRIEGKAIQTDAKISPANYGGPLINLQGEITGILAPLSPGSRSIAGGTEWYDSGIGFAIVYEQVLSRLDRLKAGEDIHPGLMGISFPAGASFLTAPQIKQVRPNSPAATAGLAADDLILEAEGVPTPTISHLKKVVGQRDAGDELNLLVQRGEEQIRASLRLVEKLLPFQPGILGILPSRAPAADSRGLLIRYVLPGSPADAAGLTKGDRVVALAQTPVTDERMLREELEVRPQSAAVRLTIERGEETFAVDLTLSSFPETLPASIPSAVDEPLAEGEKPQVGELRLSPENAEGEYFLYVPEDYHPAHAHGLILWAAADGAALSEREKISLRAACRQTNMLLLAPLKQEKAPWGLPDLPFIKECLNDLQQKYSISSSRKILFVSGEDTKLFWLFLFENRAELTGLITTSVPAGFSPPWYEPREPLRLLINADSPLPEPQQQSLQKLEQEGYPVIRISGEAEAPSRQELINRWIEIQDCL